MTIHSFPDEMLTAIYFKVGQDENPVVALQSLMRWRGVSKKFREIADFFQGSQVLWMPLCQKLGFYRWSQVESFPDKLRELVQSIFRIPYLERHFSFQSNQSPLECALIVCESFPCLHEDGAAKVLNHPAFHGLISEDEMHKKFESGYFPSYLIRLKEDMENWFLVEFIFRPKEYHRTHKQIGNLLIWLDKYKWKYIPN